MMCFVCDGENIDKLRAALSPMILIGLFCRSLLIYMGTSFDILLYILIIGMPLRFP